MDIDKFVTTKEDGTFEVDSKAFKSAFDAEISRAVEAYKNGKGKAEMRAELEKEAKLTADEKLKQEREEFENYKKSERVKLNQEKAKAKLEGKGFSEKEVEFMLGTITEDGDACIAKIEELIAERNTAIENAKKLAIEGLQKGQQSAGTKITNPDNSDRKPVVKRTAEDILNAYKQRQIM